MIKQSLAVFLFMACATFAHGEEPSPTPKTFSAHICGFMGESYQIELHGKAISYTTFGPGHSHTRQTTITPTEAQWHEFRQSLDELNIWQWRKDYPNQGTMDGTQWSLEIDYADHALTTKGDNSYPEAGGKPNGRPEPAKAFRQYLAAVQKLIGGKAFQ